MFNNLAKTLEENFIPSQNCKGRVVLAGLQLTQGRAQNHLQL